LTKEPAEQTLTAIILQTATESKPETIAQLIEQVHAQIPLSSHEEILDAVVKLQEDGRLRIILPLPSSPDLSSHPKTSATPWFWLTIATTLAASVSALMIPEDVFPLVIVRYVFGAILVLWLPGYVFIKTLFPAARPIKTTDNDLDLVERVGLSLGMSLALVAIIGLLLNYTPWGIRLTPVTLSLAALTTILAVAALLREDKLKQQK